VAKSKNEPQKSKSAPEKKKKPAAGGAVRAESAAEPGVKHAKKADPAAAEAGAARPAAPAKPGRPARAATAAPARAPRAQGRRDASKGSRADDEHGEHDGEHEGAHEEEHEHDGEHEHEEEGEVVDVVGELVDDPAVEVEDGDEPVSRLPSVSPLGNEAALSRTDPLQAYLREVQRHSLLTGDEEKMLTQRYVKNQDVQTAARLVTANLRLVVKLAYEYRRAYKNIMDLIQEGNIGLMQAVKRYDPYRGVKLSSYAAWWIRAYILRFILNNWRLVKLGTTQAQRKLFFNLNKEKAKLSAMGIEPSAAEIAHRLGVEEKEVVEMDRRLSSGEASLDAPVGDTDGRAVSRIEMLPSAGTAPDTALEVREMGELVHDRLTKFRETLKGKDGIIFDKRMRAEDPLTLQELGDEFGISRERVRQLEARLTMKLRVYLKEELGDAVGTG
jgi:RNA polymerase sigma-32 factor